MPVCVRTSARMGGSRASLILCCSGFLLLVFSFSNVVSHPQCIDSRPPFNGDGSGLLFCPQYSEYGCCTSEDDNRIMARYERIKRLIPASKQDLWTRCSDYAKTFVCQECSPFAAHIFDTEKHAHGTNLQPRVFPGLCGDYCSTFYQSCKELVHYYMEERGTEHIEEAARLDAAILAGPVNFCEETSLSDVDYCYPGLLTNPTLIGNISIEKVNQEGCLCMEPFSAQFRNPIFLKHADDGTKRMFIGEQIGQVHIMYSNGYMLPEPFLDISYDIKTSAYKGDERGMLGMAFHPNFKTNKKYYIYYSTYLSEYEELNVAADHKIRIEEFKVLDDNPDKTDYSYSRIILEVYEPFWNHNGGEVGRPCQL